MSETAQSTVEEFEETADQPKGKKAGDVHTTEGHAPIAAEGHAPVAAEGHAPVAAEGAAEKDDDFGTLEGHAPVATES